MTSEDSGDDWAFSEAKDWKDGRHRRENQFVLPEAGEITDRKARQTLQKLRAAYDRAYREGRLAPDAPASIEDTRLYRDVRKHFDSEAFSGRVEDKDSTGLRSHVGSQNDEVDVSGWHDIETVREIATGRYLRLYEFGEPGTGKTSAGCLMARHWLMARRDAGRTDAVIFTNIKSLATPQAAPSDYDSIVYVGSWPALQSEIEKLKGTDTPYLFLFDEASSKSSGGEEGYNARKKLAVLVYKIRKFGGGGSIIIIGHDGKDVTPAIRLLCKVVEKKSKKKARFYQSIRNREGKEPLTPEITEWPDCKWNPNDKDPAPWSWDEPTGDESGENGGEMDLEEAYRDLAVWLVVQAKTRDQDNPPSNPDVASEVLNGMYSTEWVRRRWNEYQDGEHGDRVGEVAQVIE